MSALNRPLHTTNLNKNDVIPPDSKQKSFQEYAGAEKYAQSRRSPIDLNGHTNSKGKGPYEVIIRSEVQQKCQVEGRRTFIYILRAPVILGRMY